MPCDDELAPTSFELVITRGVPSVRGAIDLSAATALEQWLANLDGQAVEIDFSGVTFFDSTGLRVMLAARRHNPKLRIVRASKPVLRVLEITDTIAYLAGRSAEE
jgi:anti-anti-sigma factor